MGIPTQFIVYNYIVSGPSQQTTGSCHRGILGVSWLPGSTNVQNLAFMPRLHLLQSSYNLFVYDFLYDFFGTIGGYMLRHMCLHCSRSPYDFFPRKTRTKPYRDLADIVRQPQGYHTIIVLTSQIALCPYDDLAEVSRSRYADCAIVV